jgi:hypothetical protein
MAEQTHKGTVLYVVMFFSDDVPDIEVVPTIPEGADIVAWAATDYMKQPDIAMTVYQASDTEMESTANWLRTVADRFESGDYH